MSQLPICPRCGLRKERHPGMNLIYSFTTPNRLFNPDIYTLELRNFTCSDCMDLLDKSIKEWWKSGGYFKNQGQTTSNQAKE